MHCLSVPAHLSVLGVTRYTCHVAPPALAEQLQREAFAMNVSGVHFDVSVVNMADYDQV